MGFAQQYPGGAEVELSMLFVDVRGSSSLAERMSAAELRPASSLKPDLVKR